MAAYRVNASNLQDPQPKPARRFRTPLALGITVAIHAGILAAAFMARAPEPPHPETQTVSVVRGQVDAETGDLQLLGIAEAHVRAF